MELWLIKDEQGKFHPYQDDDREKCAKIKPMEEILFKTTKLRDPVNHRRYFALIKLAFENQDNYKDVKVFRKLVEREAGYFIEVKTKNGIEKWADSISYERLDEYEFSDLYKKVWQVLHDTYGYDNELFEAEIMKMI